MQTLPLFPLSAVLLPGGKIPLKIFEQRYLDLVRHSMKNSEPFGVVWLRRGSEVAVRGAGIPDLGDHGTCAEIVDWDQLPDGLLGVTVVGTQRFELIDSAVRDDGLVMGEVNVDEVPETFPMQEEWQSLANVLLSLESHPHVERLNLSLDYDNAWSVGYGLLQLLPVEERIKHELLGLDSAEELMGELDSLLNQMGG